MPPGQNSERLRKLYPTIEKLNKEITLIGGQSNLAIHLNIHRSTLYNHKRWLEEGRKTITTQPTVCRMTDKELDKRIRDMYGSKDAEVKVYKLTDEYKSNQLTTEGLIPIRTEISQTAVSMWARRVALA